MEVPGTAGWLLSRMKPAVTLALRQELRKVQRELDATLAAVWVVGGSREFLAYVGERGVAPAELPVVESTVPSFERIRDAAGVDHDAVVARPQLGIGMPRLGLIIVGAAVEPRVLFDAVEAAGDRIEVVVVRALR